DCLVKELTEGVTTGVKRERTPVLSVPRLPVVFARLRYGAEPYELAGAKALDAGEYRPRRRYEMPLQIVEDRLVVDRPQPWVGSRDVKCRQAEHDLVGQSSKAWRADAGARCCQQPGLSLMVGEEQHPSALHGAQCVSGRLFQSIAQIRQRVITERFRGG